MSDARERRLEIVRWNIARYARLLESEMDPVRVATLRSLLAEARNEEMLIKDEGAFEQSTSGVPELRQDAKRWRMKAEEYRTVADATASEAARNTYRHLARNYDLLAERAELKTGGQEMAGPRSKPESTTNGELERIRHWRLRAAELRATADNMKDPDARLGMLNAAATYEALADDAEGRTTPFAERAG